MKERCLKAQRFFGFDWLKGISAMFVISVHLSITTLPSFERISIFGAQTAIEIFAAISGFLLALRCDKSQKNSFFCVIMHRAVGILPAYLKWTAFYLLTLSLFDYAFGVPAGYLANINLLFLAKAILRGAAEIHLWFVPSLFLATVLLVVLDRILSAAAAHYWAWAYLICGAAIGLCVNYYAKTNFLCHDIRIFGWMMIGMSLSRIFRWNYKNADMLHHIRKIATFVLILNIITCVIAYGTHFWHVHDMTLVLLLLLVFSNPAIQNSRVASFFSRTSIFVYYSHLFVSRIFAIINSPRSGGGGVQSSNQFPFG